MEDAKEKGGEKTGLTSQNSPEQHPSILPVKVGLGDPALHYFQTEEAPLESTRRGVPDAASLSLLTSLCWQSCHTLEHGINAVIYCSTRKSKESDSGPVRQEPARTRSEPSTDGRDPGEKRAPGPSVDTRP